MANTAGHTRCLCRPPTVITAGGMPCSAGPVIRDILIDDEVLVEEFRVLGRSGGKDGSGSSGPHALHVQRVACRRGAFGIRARYSTPSEQ